MRLIHGDCLEEMFNIPDKSVDMVCCDLPYGKTKNKWDSVIDLEKLWAHYERIIKNNSAMVFTAQDKFSAKLMLSNEKLHRYNLVWDKQLTSGFLNANRMPLRVHEDILIFYKKLPAYNPQKVKGKTNHSKGQMRTNENNNYGKYDKVDNKTILGDMKHPKSIISFQKPHPSKCLHPTQKPIALIEYLIKTYTNEGDTILDNCMGSGTTIVAADNLNRNSIGIEIDKEYFDIAVERINKNRERLKNEQ
jgi:site-specific DNA-methyltransferase (adenine-specific)